MVQIFQRLPGVCRGDSIKILRRTRLTTAPPPPPPLSSLTRSLAKILNLRNFIFAFLKDKSLKLGRFSVKHLKNSSTTNVCKFNTYPLLTYSNILPKTSAIRTFLFGFLRHLPPWFLSCSVLFIIYFNYLSGLVY